MRMPNRAAAGYYRWRLPDAQTRVLIAGAGPGISPRERLSLADSLTAGLAAGIVVTAGTPYLEQGLVALVSGGLTVVGGFSLLIHTLVDWGLIGPKHDFWSGRPGLRLAVGPGVLVGRW